MQAFTLDQPDHIYSVSRLNNEVRVILEENFPFVWVEGEISNFAAPNSGHWYFAIKDAQAQVRCAMFRANQRKINFQAKDGMMVLLKARVSLYENRGEFQLIVEEMEERGEGKLRAAFEMLKKKLAHLGLFDDIHKKTLPLFPKQLGVVTSATGAALRDILTVLKRRHAGLPLIIYPTLVQGAQAAKNIAAAIEIANRRKECDVLIVARGGGSLEDLWAFNEEIVAHAIFNSHIPIVSAIGHEVDFTIADFVADKRAPTPSAAAEIVSPDCAEILQSIVQYHQQILKLKLRRLQSLRQQINWQQKHLTQQHPKHKLQEKFQRLDFYELNLLQQQTRVINQVKTKINQLENRLHQLTPLKLIAECQNQIALIQEKINTQIKANLNQSQTLLANAATTLDALSPLATLKRGFAIVSAKGKVVKEAAELNVGDNLHIQFLNSDIDCQVTRK